VDVVERATTIGAALTPTLQVGHAADARKPAVLKRAQRRPLSDLDEHARALARRARAHERPQRTGDPALAADHLADVVGRDVQARALSAPSRSSVSTRTASGSSTSSRARNASSSAMS
jgi:hypothetical protein